MDEQLHRYHFSNISDNKGRFSHLAVFDLLTKSRPPFAAFPQEMAFFQSLHFVWCTLGHVLWNPHIGRHLGGQQGQSSAHCTF